MAGFPTHLIEAKEICARLHIQPPTLRRWEAKGVIPFYKVGPGKRYIEHQVEAALRLHRFGPPLSPHLSHLVLRERVRPEIIFRWLHRERKTLQRRMDDGTIPYYKIGQTYLFAPDEVEYSLGIAGPASVPSAPSISFGGLL